MTANRHQFLIAFVTSTMQSLLRITLLAILLNCYGCASSSTAIKWAWMGGSLTPLGIYAQQHIPTPSTFPGARYHAAFWYDSSSQELWLFGGKGYGSRAYYYGLLNDLWRYRMNDSTWTWISGSDSSDESGVYGEKGIANTTNAPGARYAATGWYDSLRQEFWLFGGFGFSSQSTLGYLNDLWRYRMNDSTWTWMGGSNDLDHKGVYGEQGVANTSYLPRSRSYALGWYDSSTQEFWLFGGSVASGYLNDLWRYRMNDSTWTWISGNDTTNQPGMYKEKGNARTDNAPGSRYGAVGLYDGSTQEFWVFGGIGCSSNCIYGYLNDLWRYRMNDSTWTWISGSDTIYHPGEFGDKGIPNTSYVPSSRNYAVGWYDSLRREFWLLGGSVGYHNSDLPTNDLWRYEVNENTWTWLSGENPSVRRGKYGEKDKPSVENIPAARSDAVGFYDSSTQEFWLFGGNAPKYTGNLNDLWRYRMNDSTWTWMGGSNELDHKGVYGEKGIANTTNTPGARYGAVGVYDSLRQEFWLFGGMNHNIDMGILNDLWRYRTNDSTWTWVSGSNTTRQLGVYGEKGTPNIANVPGARRYAIGWYDSSRQEFWLFGGESGEYLFEHLNDLWKYNVINNTWTWISGNNTINQPGVYGEKGISHPDSYPGARKGAVGWYDSLREELWLFGGFGYANTSNYGLLNDVWRYRMNDSTWTWFSGTFTIGHPGIYGEKGNASTENVPCARSNAVGWYDSLRQEFWLFGGKGYGNADESDYGNTLNDLWRYRVNDNTWTWMGGSNTPAQPGVYGEKGVASSEFVPDSRYGAVGWYDSSQHELWLFGGYNDYGELNDIWKVILPTPEEQSELCPPLHHHINNTCIPDFECFSSDADDNSKCTLECDSFSTNTSSTASSNCLLECGSTSELSSSVESNCVIEGDMAVNRSVGETTTTVTIIGVINVTGDVSVIGQATLKLSSGATLHIGKCLTLDEKAQVVAEVESGVMNGSVLLTFDPSCSSSELSQRVKVESKQSMEEMCRDGQPMVEEEEVLEEGGMRRTQLTLLFVPMSGSDECDVSDESGSDWKILVIAIVVPVVVLVVIVIVVVMAVTRIRKKVVPGSLKLSASDKISQLNL